ncbi:unnamed protein product [Didymodactylos carnosus]|nr:unnamed protein product [Didymodactylos carnosus]CAF4251389.1 unnamed protein product [Didymodactylos carnosus]
MSAQPCRVQSKMATIEVDSDRQTPPTFGHVIYDSHQDKRYRNIINPSETELLNGPLKYQNNQSVAEKTMFFNSKSTSTNDNNMKSVRDNEELSNTVDKLLEKYAPDPIQSSNTNQLSFRAQQQQKKDTTVANDYQIIRNNPTTSPTTADIKKPVQTRSQPSVQNTPAPPKQSVYNNLNHHGHQPKTTTFANKNANISNGAAPSTIPFTQGKLYNTDGDPLLALYDKQTKTNNKGFQSRHKQQQPSTVSSQTVQYPQGSNTYDQLFHTYTNTSYPTTQKPQPSSSNLPSSFQPHSQFSNLTNDRLIQEFYSNSPQAASTPVQEFDLGNLIKQVQQDYLKEIEPFVSSVKFIERNPELRPELSRLEFSTPVSVRKG